MTETVEPGATCPSSFWPRGSLLVVTSCQTQDLSLLVTPVQPASATTKMWLGPCFPELTVPTQWPSPQQGRRLTLSPFSEGFSFSP